jgi:hypothetical protein
MTVMKSMKAVRFSIPACGVLIGALAASPAAADVTLKQKTSGKGPIGAAADGESTTYIKGLKFRSDQTAGNRQTSMLMDAGGSQMIVLNHEKKEADVFDMAKMNESMGELVSVSDIKSSFTPTGQTRQIAGSTCAVYDVSITMPVKIANMPMTMAMTGPYCLVKDGPGQADFAAFYKAAAEKGFVFGDPRAAKASPTPRAMTEMYRKMSELGVPFAMDTTIKTTGEGPMAALMGKMGNAGITSEVISASTESIAQSMFEIPAGYKINKR